MVGINVGASKITFNNRVRVILDSTATPKDFLLRAAAAEKIVSLQNNKPTVRDPLDDFSNKLVAALKQQQITATDFALAYPGWWGQETVKRLRKTLHEKGLTPLLVNDAEAALTQFQTETATNLPETVIVLNIDSVAATMVVVTNAKALTNPSFVLAEGGDLLDKKIMQHLVAQLTDLGDIIDPAAEETIAAAKRSIPKCRELREKLSTQAAATFELKIPGASHQIRLVRSELERLTKPWVDSLATAVATIVEQSDTEIGGVLITGGLSRMPLISQRISADLGLQVFVSENPQFLIAKGCQKIFETQSNKTNNIFAAWRKFFTKPKPQKPVIAAKSMADLSAEIFEDKKPLNKQPVARKTTPVPDKVGER